MGKWKEVNFAEVVDNFDGKRVPIKASERKNSEGGKYPYYGASGIIDYVDDFIFEGEHLLISEDGANLLARVYPIAFKADGKFWVNNHAHIVKAKKEKTTNDYLEYYFSSIDISEYVTGSAQPKLNQKKLNSIKIPLPKLPEQQRIVAKLDSLFAKIDQAIGLLEENIGYTQALMGSVLDEEFGSSEHNLKPIKELVLKTKTLSPKTEYSNDEFTYIDISSVNKDIFQIETPKTLLGNEAPSRARKVVENGDIVFATTRPNLKNIAIISECYNNPIASTGFCLLRTKKDLLNNEYLFYFLISERLQEYIQPLIRGAQYPAISDKDLLSIEIPLLSRKEQENTVSFIKSVFDVSNSLVKTQTRKLNHLKALKSSLLDRAFKGEL